MVDQGKRVHLVAYNYSLVHHNPGRPLTPKDQEIIRQPIYQMTKPINQGYDLGATGNTSNDKLVNENLLLQLTDCDTLDEIRVISLRNKSLTSCLKILSQCENLTIGYLQGNAINLQDLMYLQMFKNLKKIDLSENDIKQLPGPAVLSGLVNLKFFYLHNNKISNWNDLLSLTGLPSIMHITLFSNPVCSIPGYRQQVVTSLPKLLALDNYVITDEERLEDASFGYRFRALNEYMKLHIPDYAKEKSAEQHLFNLEVDIYRLKRIHERNSPTILIQSLYRGYRSRNFVKVYFNERKNKIIKIQKVVRGWLLRKKLKNDLKDMLAYTGQEYLLMSNAELRKRHAGSMIKKFMIKKFREKKKMELEDHSALTIQRYYRGRYVRNQSFIKALNLQNNPKIYFLKEQKPIFMKIIKSLMPLFEEKHGLTLENMIRSIREDNNYDTIRVAEPDLFEYKSYPLVQFTKPSAISKIRFSKHSKSGDHIFKDENFSLINMLFTNNKEYTLNKWKKLRIRNCTVKKNKIQNAVDKQKRNPSKNQYLFQDQYRDFLIFQPQHIDVLITVCFAILDHNRVANEEGDQQFLLFFESLLERVSAATRIQQNFRGYLFRQKLRKYPIQQIIEKRASYCIQRWWSDIKLQKRMKALSKIKQFIDRISSSEIYLEQTIYSYITQIVDAIHSQMKFEEQHVYFDFNSLNHQIYLHVNEREKGKYRYNQLAIPKWFNLNLRCPEFSPTHYQNDVQAIFHFNHGDCQIMPVNYVINYETKILDIDRNLCFLQLQCSSVEEAKRRAYILAILTYDIHQHMFVQLSTAEMLQDPFTIQGIYKIKQRFDLIHIPEDPVDVKVQFYEQRKQKHQGVVFSEKDQRYSRFNAQLNLKKIQLDNQRTVMIQCQDNEEAKIMDKEILKKESRSYIDLQSQLPNFYETKKLHQEAFNIIKERRLQAMRESIQEFKDLKVGQKSFMRDQTDKYIEDKREEVNKIREIGRIIQMEQKNELNKNLAVFLTLNKEEKVLRRELVEKQQEVDFKEKYLKKMTVIQHHRNRQVKKEEQDKFINAFSQAKNLIEKQMKIGNRIKEKKIHKQVNREKVLGVRQQRQEGQNYEKQAIKSVLFDNSINESVMQNSRAQMLKYDSYASKKTDFMTNNMNQLTTMADEGYINKSRQVAKSTAKSQNRSYFLPPLHEQSFNDENYGQQHQQINQTFHTQQTANDYELHRDIEEIYKNTVQNRNSWKKRPVFAEESYPLIKGNTNMSFERSGDANRIGSGGLSLKQNLTDQSRYVSSGGQKSREAVEIRLSTRRQLVNNMNMQ